MVRSETEKELDNPRMVLQPPQFRLRTMLLVTAVICGLLTLMVTLGMAWALGLLMLILLMGAHVVGNALGTRLRDGSDGPPVISSTIFDPFAAKPTDQPPPAAEWRSMKTNRMQEKLPVSWLFLILAAAGAVAGGIIGGLIVFSLYGNQLSWISACTAILASGVMGGIAAFVTGTFIDMVRRVWGEATSEQSPFKKGS